MNINKNEILDMLKSQGQNDTADQANAELPDQVDTDNDDHKNILAKLGLNPADLISKFAGDLPGGLGEAALMIGLIVSLIVIGLLAGALARLIIPGKQDIGIPMTILIGIIGSFVGGFLGYLIFHHNKSDGFFQPSGIVGSVIGAVLVLFVYLRFSGRRGVRA